MSLKKISFKLNQELYDAFMIVVGNNSLSEYIRKIIIRELANQTNSVHEMSSMIKSVEQLNTQKTEKIVTDINVKQQVLFKEINKQNEVLKLIHRRVTLASSFAVFAVDELKKNNNFSVGEKNKLIEIIENEIKEIGL